VSRAGRVTRMPAPAPWVTIMDEPGSPFVSVIVACGTCRAVIARRRFDSRQQGAGADLAQETAGLMDGDALERHRCLTQ
jgi:hypothetical protein